MPFCLRSLVDAHADAPKLMRPRGQPASNRSPILLVPSVMVPEEWAALINPDHPLSGPIAAKVVRPFEYNKLFRR